MKKIVCMVSTVAVAIIFSVLVANPASAQTEEKTKTLSSSIPADVAQVMETSCIHCHMAPGNSMAMSHVNLGKWDEYDASKQASKAAAMSKMLNKGKMPPKKFRSNNPEKVPTDADVKAISNWAKSLEAKK